MGGGWFAKGLELELKQQLAGTKRRYAGTGEGGSI
jgi:hypothetical protein